MRIAAVAAQQPLERRAAIGGKAGEQEIGRAAERGRLPGNLRCARRGEHGGRFADGTPDCRSNRKLAVVGEGREPQTAHVDGRWILEFRARIDQGIAGAVEDAQRHDEVRDVPRHRAGLAHDRALPDRQAMGAMVGRASGGRPDRGDAAERRGNAQAAADIVAEPKRRSAGGDQRRLTAARAAARPFQIPRIVGAAVQRIVGFGINQQLRRVALGDRDGAGGKERGDVRIVFAFDRVAPRRQPEGRGGAGEIETLLDRDRQSGERTKLVAARAGLVDVRGSLARAVEQRDGHGVELGIDGFEPRDEGFDDLDGG